MIEALANGLPVAAYNVTGPKDIVDVGKTGFLGNNLEVNIRKCLKLNRKKIAFNINQQWSWNKCVKILHSHLLG